MSINENALAMFNKNEIADRPVALAFMSKIESIAQQNESTMFDFAAEVYAASTSAAFLAEMCKQSYTKQDGTTAQYKNKDFAKYLVESLGMSKTWVYDTYKMGKYIATVDNDRDRRAAEKDGKPIPKRRTKRRFCLVWDASEKYEYQRDENGMVIVNPDTQKPVVIDSWHEYDFDKQDEYSFAAAQYISTYDIIIMRKLHRDGIISPNDSVRRLKDILPQYKDARLDSNTGNIIYSPDVLADLKNKEENEKAKQAAAAEKSKKHETKIPVEYSVNGEKFIANIPLDVLEKYTEKDDENA